MMRRLASLPLAFGRFWYEFIVGDDWTVAVAVVAALAVTAVVNGRGVVIWWLVPAVVVTMVTVSLLRHRP